jgi:MoaA/NifB/PqqE/SkfB family radical SAM enzyme
MIKKAYLAKNILASNFGRLASPYKITFVLTYRCNLKCKICRIWGKDIQDELDITKIEKLFKGLNNLSWLDLTGGEITLREDLFDVVRVIAKQARKMLVLHISSNGQLPDILFKLAKEIVKLGLVPVINVALDGPREFNDQLKGANGAYENSISAFRKLKELKQVNSFLSCTVSRHNIKHIDDLLVNLRKDLPKFSYSDFHFNIFHNSSHYYANAQTDAFPEVGFEGLKKYFDLGLKGGFIKNLLTRLYIKGLRQYCSGERFPVRCQALNSTCFISPDGSIYPCGLYDRRIGNLKDYNYDLMKLWISKESVEARKEIVNMKCQGCWSPCEAYPAILGRLIKGAHI